MKNITTPLLRTTTLAIIGLVLSAQSAFAQAGGQPVIAGATLVHGGSENDPGQFLGNAYKDETAGYRITPPLGARTISRAGLELMSFVQDEKGWGGSLQKVLLNKVSTLDAYADTVVRELTTAHNIRDAAGNDVQVKTFKGVQVLSKTAMKVQDHPAIKLTMSMQADIVQANDKPGTLQLYRQQLIVQTADNLFFVLTCYSPLGDRQNAEKAFDAVGTSLELFNPEDMTKKRAAAIEAGKKWLDQRTAEELKTKMGGPQLFRIIVGGANGKDYGYVQFDEVETTRDGMKGIEEHMLSRTFPNNSIVKGQNVAFWAYSKNDAGVATPHYSMWDNISEETSKVVSQLDKNKLVDKTFWVQESGILTMETNPRYTDADIKQLEDQRDQLIRLDPSHPPPEIDVAPRQYHIIVKIDGDDLQSTHAQMKPNQPLDNLQGNGGGASGVANSAVDVKIPPRAAAPLFRTLDYVWPRLVDLAKPSEMSFLVFNPSTQKLALRTLIVTGRKETITLNGVQSECWRVVDELDPGSTTMWVDNNGKIMSMRTSDQTVLAPTTSAEMEKKWQSQISARP